MKVNRPAIFVARGASYILTQKIAYSVMQILAFAAIARLISQVDMGILAVLTLTIGLFSAIISLGLPVAATKFIAEYVGKGDRQSTASIFYQILRVNLIISIAAASFCFVFSDSISLFLLQTTTYTGLFRVLALDIVAAGMLSTLHSSLLGLQKIREVAIFNLIGLAIRLILIVLLLLLGFGLFGIVFAWLLGNLANCLLYIRIIFKSLGPPTFSFSLRHILRFSYPLYFSGILGFIYGWFDQVLLLASLSLSELGVYSVALRAFGVLQGVTIAISTTLFPKYSEMHGRNGVKSVEKAIPDASRYICYTTMPLAFGLLAVARPAITLFAGAAYSIGSQPLVILCFFFAIVCIQTALSGILSILEKTLIVSGLTLANIAIGFIFSVLLLPPFGILGLSIARGITMLSSLFLLIWVLRKKIKLTLDKEAFWKSLTSSAIMAIVVSGVEHLWYSNYLLPIYLALGTITYLGMLKILNAARKTDIELIRLYMGKRFEFLTKRIEVFFLGQE